MIEAVNLTKVFNHEAVVYVTHDLELAKKADRWIKL